jgi:hypothetical protein
VQGILSFEPLAKIYRCQPFSTPALDVRLQHV